MSRIRSTMRQSPAIIIALIALTFSLGGGAGYAASVATAKAPAVKIHWTALHLINGWTSGKNYYKSSRLNTGSPAYAVLNGVVYLSGSVDTTNSSITGDAFTVLPKGARPAHELSIAAVGELEPFGTPAVGSITITTGGRLYTNMISSDNLYFTFLGGVSFALGT
jgi:hypothetical protein